MQLTRLAAAATAAAALALTGCGSSGSGTETGTASASEGSSTTASSFPVSVDTAFGEVTVEAEPQHVVALGWGDAETALALEVQPVGASDWLGFGGEGVGPWAAGRYDEPPTIIETLEPSYEAIAALEPDLILDTKSSGDRARYDRLTEIAPTVGVPEGGEDYLTTTEQQVELVSTALGRAEEGEALLADLDAAFAAAAQAHPDWEGRTATAATRTSEGWGAYVEGSERVAFLERLGFVQNPQVAALPTSATGFTVDISSEQLDLLDSDLVVAFPIFIPTTDITDDPLWQAVPAVADGRAIVIDGDLSQAYSLGGVLSSQYALEQLVPQVEAALGGA